MKNISIIIQYKHNILYKYIFKIIISILLFIFIIISFIIKNKKTSICLCVIGKNENLYVKEYVKYYKKLGYNHIYIYDNNNIKSENFTEILKEYIKDGYISIIDYIGYRGKDNNSQKEAYFDCYEKYKIYYDWLSFFDFDEFLELKNQTIQEFLDDNIFNCCQIIKINWLAYTSRNELLYYENKSLQKRFNIPDPNNLANKHIKSIIRGNLNDNYWKNWMNPHSSLNNLTSCSSSGKIVDSNSPFIEPPDYTYAHLKHFGNKSFEEYCYKLKRGSVY